MVVLQATKLSLPQSPSFSSPLVSSLLFDPQSLSLALMHSDSSFSLYPSFSPFSLSSSSSSSLSPPQTFIQSPCSSATFLRLQSASPNSAPRVLFVVASPHLGAATVLLRFWILRKSQSFSKALVLCNQSGIRFDRKRSGVVLDVNHGISVKLVGSINVLAMYSAANFKIWIFAAKMVGDEEDGVSVKLMKTAVIDCLAPIFSVSVSLGFLILGEENGVRVFPLRPLVKGRVRNQKREKKSLNGPMDTDRSVGRRRSNLPNGTIQTIDGSHDLHSDSSVHSNCDDSYGGSKRTGGEGSTENSSNGHFEGKIHKKYDNAKLRPVKLRDVSREGVAFFMPFKANEDKNSESTKIPPISVKAISVEVLSPNEFLILDSIGDLHVLSFSNHVLASETPSHMKLLSNTMKVQKLAVLPDNSTRNQTVWVSDGHYTVHMTAMTDVDIAVIESDTKDSEEKPMQISVTQAIFPGEKIQDIIPFAANAILILGQGNIFVYATV